MTALLVDHGALFVHHVVVFEQVFTDAEVVFLYLLLCALNGIGYHRTLDAFAIFKSETVHHFGDALAAEKAHEFVFERNVEHRGPRVALTACTTAQLAVYTAALMALGADDSKSTGGLHLR